MTVPAIVAGLKLASITLANLILIKNFIIKIRKLLKKGTSHTADEEALLAGASKIINKAIREAKPIPKAIKTKRSNPNNMNSKSGDLKPQILTLITAIGPASAYVTATSILPVPRFGTTKTKATIFELLWVHWYLAIDTFSIIDVVRWAWLSTVNTRATGEVTSLVTSLEDLQDPRAFAFVMEETQFAVQGLTYKSVPVRMDLTDNNGNGILIATDRLQITGGAFGAGASGSFVAKVGYRLVNVGIQEYVGIVASQQGT